jgi:hypothetical protein
LHVLAQYAVEVAWSGDASMCVKDFWAGLW